MGLDSVELVMEWEDFFKLKIPDLEAAKMATIADAVTYISSQVEFVERGVDIKATMLSDLEGIFSLKSHVSLEEFLRTGVPPDEKALWKKMSGLSGYELPIPTNSHRVEKWYDKLLPKKAPYEPVTINRYIDLVCAVNYNALIQGSIQNQYEVMIAVMGITIEKNGLDPFEVYWDSSFTNDLGID
ncbi:hypothetical protein [Desertivirga brevis]|uniref:hypothetical protein n=1 Tax=Desertivirga brevis TaxID=2810310 RepID=UPI001A97B322|nr:hypothetical protein [Pedobacter sp. SYSU D00873]